MAITAEAARRAAATLRHEKSMSLKRPLQAIFGFAVVGFVVRAYLASRIKDQHVEMRATQDARTRAALARDIESAKRRAAAALA